MSIVAEALRRALEREGVTQAELARYSCLSAKHVNQILTGKVALSVDVALRFEAAIPRLSAEDLMVAQARDQVRAAKVTP